MHARRPDERAFTLIELLVVMIIIAILMAVAVPTFLAQKSTAKKTQALANIKMIVKAAETCAANQTNGTMGNCTFFSALSTYEQAMASLPAPTSGAPGVYDIDPIEGGVVYPSLRPLAQGYLVWTSIQDGDQQIWFAEIHREDGSLLKWCGAGDGRVARSYGAASSTRPPGVPGSRTCPTGSWG